MVCDAPKALPFGGRTKPALSTPPEGVTGLDLSAISGVVAYEPGEFTFTAWAGTPLADVKSLLDSHGQYMPFDPPLVKRGATLGGTVAAGLSGPGRYRYGGVRDFLLGIAYVDGQGQLVHGGGKVVKNAAGFDIPKLMIGSMGRLGVLVELTFKVFPQPERYITLRREVLNVEEAVRTLLKFSNSQLDLEAFEIEMLESAAVVWVRLGGLAKGLPARLERLRLELGGGSALEGTADEAIWSDMREFAWVPAGWSLVKVPLTPGRIPAFEAALRRLLDSKSLLRRYSGGGQMAWVAAPVELAAPENLARLDNLLLAQALSGLVVFGPPELPRLGVRIGDSFARRVKTALDPSGRFLEV